MHGFFNTIIRAPQLRVIEGDKETWQIWRWWHVDEEYLSDEELDQVINAAGDVYRKLKKVRYKRKCR